MIYHNIVQHNAIAVANKDITSTYRTDKRSHTLAENTCLQLREFWEYIKHLQVAFTSNILRCGRYSFWA